MQIKVLGLTNPREVTVGSRDHNFRVSEYIVIEDPVIGDVLGEVVESTTYNRFIPLDIGGDFVDDDVLASLNALGFDVQNETIYIGKVRFVSETVVPPLTGSDGRRPTFAEVEDILVPTPPTEGLTLGAIRNTEYLYDEMEATLKDLFRLYEAGGAAAQQDVPYILDIRAMHQYPHIGIFGGSGSGKSFGMRVLMEELMEKRIPALVLDPHYEMDFSNAASGGKDYADRHNRFQIGGDIGVKFEDISAGDLKNLLSAVSDLSEAMESAVDLLFRKNNSIDTFRGLIDDLIRGHEEGGEARIRQIADYAEGPQALEWKRILENFVKYGRSTNMSSLRGILWRLKNLQFAGLFNRDSRAIEETLFAGKVAVIQGSARLIQMYSTYLIRHLYGLRRNYKDAGFLHPGEGEFFPPFFVVTDESHTFAPKGIPAPSKSVIREIAQEGRKYGVFLILATQRPTLLDDTVTAQLNCKMIFRTVRAQDIQTIRDETDISAEEAARLPYLTTGDVFISSSHLGRTTFARIRMANTESPHTENPFDELRGARDKAQTALMDGIRPYLPINVSSDLLYVQKELDTVGIHYTAEELKTALDALSERGLLVCKKNMLNILIYEEV